MTGKQILTGAATEDAGSGGGTSNVNITEVGGTTVTSPLPVSLSAGSTTAVTQATASNLNAQVVGNVASGSNVAGNPVQIGGRAANVAPTAVSSGQVVEAMFDLNGRHVICGAPRGMKGVGATTITASTAATSIIASQGAGVYADLYGLILANISSTSIYVTISDGTNSYVIFVPANDTRGFMLPAGDAVPATSTATAWTATCSASITSMDITAMWVNNKA